VLSEIFIVMKFHTKFSLINNVYRQLYEYLLIINTTQLNEKGPVKAIPLQALTGPEGSSRLRLPDFNTIGT
jgi:hypothetical protein